MKSKDDHDHKNDNEVSDDVIIILVMKILLGMYKKIKASQ